MPTRTPTPPDQRPRLLYGKDLISYIIGRARALHLEPAVALALVPHEGGFYGAVGDNGSSYGPWQLHRGGALPANLSDAQARAFANSPAGIDYALGQIKTAITSHPGHFDIGGGYIGGTTAVHNAVTFFERPQNPAAEDAAARQSYFKLAHVEGNAADWTSGGTGPFFRYPAAAILALLGGGAVVGSGAGGAIARGAGRTARGAAKGAGSAASSLEGKTGIALGLAALALFFQDWAVRIIEVAAGSVLILLGLIVFGKAASGSSTGAATRGAVGLVTP